MAALDANRDGKISKQEIKNAQAALAKLDKNKDGKLSSEEIGWPPNFGGGRTRSGGFSRGVGRGGSSFGGFGGRFGSQDRPPVRPTAEQTDSPRPTNRRPTNGRPQSGQPPRSSGRTFFTLEQLKRVDRNRDGKITRDEVPRGLQNLIFGRLDTNKDNVIDTKELQKTGAPQKKNK